jgi:hypothetical protein
MSVKSDYLENAISIQLYCLSVVRSMSTGLNASKNFSTSLGLLNLQVKNLSVRGILWSCVI